MNDTYFPTWREVIPSAAESSLPPEMYLLLLSDDVDIIYVPTNDINIIFVYEEHEDSGIDAERMGATFKLIAAGEQESPCSICLEQISADEQIYDLECDHKFHAPCLLQWVARNATCPCCRKKISC